MQSLLRSGVLALLAMGCVEPTDEEGGGAGPRDGLETTDPPGGRDYGIILLHPPPAFESGPIPNQLGFVRYTFATPRNARVTLTFQNVARVSLEIQNGTGWRPSGVPISTYTINELTLDGTYRLEVSPNAGYRSSFQMSLDPRDYCAVEEEPSTRDVTRYFFGGRADLRPGEGDLLDIVQGSALGRTRVALAVNYYGGFWVNPPDQVVLSGTGNALDAFIDERQFYYVARHQFADRSYEEHSFSSEARAPRNHALFFREGSTVPVFGTTDQVLENWQAYCAR